jgi:hypothetical protein
MTGAGSQASTPTIRMNNDWLAEIGLADLAPDLANEVLAFAYETLEMNVGMRLAGQMTSDELDEFESFIDLDDEHGALAWLDEKFPDYREVVQTEFALLSGRLRDDAERLLAALAEERSA